MIVFGERRRKQPRESSALSASTSPEFARDPAVGRKGHLRRRGWRRIAVLHGVGNDRPASTDARAQAATCHKESHGRRHLAGDSHTPAGAGARPGCRMGDASSSRSAESSSDSRTIRYDRGHRVSRLHAVVVASGESSGSVSLEISSPAPRRSRSRRVNGSAISFR